MVFNSCFEFWFIWFFLRYVHSCSNQSQNWAFVNPRHVVRFQGTIYETPPAINTTQTLLRHARQLRNFVSPLSAASACGVELVIWSWESSVRPSRVPLSPPPIFGPTATSTPTVSYYAESPTPCHATHRNPCMMHTWCGRIWHKITSDFIFTEMLIFNNKTDNVCHLKKFEWCRTSRMALHCVSLWFKSDDAAHSKHIHSAKSVTAEFLSAPLRIPFVSCYCGRSTLSCQVSTQRPHSLSNEKMTCYGLPRG